MDETPKLKLKFPRAPKKLYETEKFAEGYSKLQLASIQINAAIEMLFEAKHPVAVHTVAAAGLQIVRDLATIENTEGFQKISKNIAGRYDEKEFWKRSNDAWGFFKHADRKPNAKFAGISEAVNDYTILFAIELYRSLGRKPSTPMNTFLTWLMCLRPEMIKEDVLKATIQQGLLDNRVTAISRENALEAGRRLLLQQRGDR